MAIEVRLPQWGEANEGTILEWFKNEGDEIIQGEPLVEVETAKVTVVMEAPVSGTVARIYFPKGAVVQIGELMALVVEAGEEGAPLSIQDKSTPSLSAVLQPEMQVQIASIAPREPRKIEPRARRLAKKWQIDLSTIQGTGREGKITVEDIEKAKESAVGQTLLKEDYILLSGRRKTIADRMLQASHDTAMLTHTTEADVTNLAMLQPGLRERGIRPLHVIIKAVALALRDNPKMNAYIKGDEMKVVPEINIGVAVDTEEGLIVPVVHNADEKAISAIAEEVKDLAEKARKRKLSIQEVTGGTFTVSNLGALDTDIFTPILNQPEVGILGLGRMVEKPAIYNGIITKRTMIWLSLTFDHRAIDGAPASTFLRDVKRRVEDLSWLIP